jgi:hypothetical protein
MRLMSKRKKNQEAEGCGKEKDRVESYDFEFGGCNPQSALTQTFPVWKAESLLFLTVI